MARNTLLAVIAALIGAAVAITFLTPAQDDEAARSGAFLPPGGEFELQSAAGPVALADLRGKLVLIYFGYTYCPDVCPTSLAFMAQAFGRLEAPELERVQGVFISVDPARDTPERLAQYSTYFHPKVIGLTGERTAIDDITRRYGVAYYVNEPDANGEYAVDHSSYTYMVDEAGKLVRVLAHGTPPEAIVEALRAAL